MCLFEDFRGRHKSCDVTSGFKATETDTWQRFLAPCTLQKGHRMCRSAQETRGTNVRRQDWQHFTAARFFRALDDFCVAEIKHLSGAACPGFSFSERYSASPCAPLLVTTWNNTETVVSTMRTTPDMERRYIIARAHLHWPHQ